MDDAHIECFHPRALVGSLASGAIDYCTDTAGVPCNLTHHANASIVAVRRPHRRLEHRNRSGQTKSAVRPGFDRRLTATTAALKAIQVSA